MFTTCIVLRAWHFAELLLLDAPSVGFLAAPLGFLLLAYGVFGLLKKKPAGTTGECHKGT